MYTMQNMKTDRKDLNAPPPQHKVQTLEDFYQQCVLFSEKTESQFLQALIDQRAPGVAS